MGYTTDFEGEFTLDKELDDKTFALLKGLASTRRMSRKVGPEYGIEGEFYVDGEGFMGQGAEDHIINSNKPPKTQPGLWCQWLIQDDRKTIKWDGGEKFYHYTTWIRYLIERVLAPAGYTLNGQVKWSGEDRLDNGIIDIINNQVDVKIWNVTEYA